jgi:hypothetical protein
MTTQIHKYTLPMNWPAAVTITVKAGAKFLSAGAVSTLSGTTQIEVWAIIDTNAPDTTGTFLLAEAGADLPPTIWRGRCLGRVAGRQWEGHMFYLQEGIPA